jgi:hypothetical protein
MMKIKIKVKIKKSKDKSQKIKIKFKILFWGQGDAPLWGAVVSPPVTPPF